MTEYQFKAAIHAGKGLIAAMDERDRSSGWHANRVATLAERVGQEFGLSRSEIFLARTAGLYHDIGKVAIPDSILFNPGPHTQNEWNVMQTHAVIGERILYATENPQLCAIAPYVRNHHERFDGTGYPDRLKHAEIPRVTQVISITDAYDAMASQRPYRAQREHLAILPVLASEVGTKWAEGLFNALVRVFERDPTLADSRLMFARLKS